MLKTIPCTSCHGHISSRNHNKIHLLVTLGFTFTAWIFPTLSWNTNSFANTFCSYCKMLINSFMTEVPCSANQWNVIYMIGTTVMKELIGPNSWPNFARNSMTKLHSLSILRWNGTGVSPVFAQFDQFPHGAFQCYVSAIYETYMDRS